MSEDILPFPGVTRLTAGEGRAALGEVIGASYRAFTAESYQLHELPPLGGLVVAEDVLGLVYDAKTEGLGPISAKGKAADADGAVYQIHPDLTRTLRSQFSALVVAHYAWTADRTEPLEARRLVYTYPDTPPRLHYRTSLCSEAELLRFTERPQYLRLLMQATDCPVDEVIIYVLSRAYTARGGDRAHLLRTTEFLGRLLKGQYDRLVAILETVESLIADDAPAPLPPAGSSLGPGVGQELFIVQE
ncbi:MAG: hypothetical protein M3Z04_21240 [Chloroflexota bacterium]|nr:hypothetical protein [Chloroflexota bacterium]